MTSPPNPETASSAEGSEIHLFVVWEAGRHCESRILQDLQLSFEIVSVHEVIWQPSRVSENFTRFYGTKLPPGSIKEVHCGTGPFLAIIVRDPAPFYGLRKTSKGMRRLNVNTFDAKSRYREWTGGGHRIHATNDETETRHDVVLLFGEPVDDFVGNLMRPWDGRFKPLHADIVGSEGWISLRQFFMVLNETTNYLVLRGHEFLSESFSTAKHGDIDLLTESPEELAFLANASKLFPEDHRVHYEARVGGDRVFFDFRYIGDDYYDKEWSRSMLETRLLNERGFHVMSLQDYFYSLLYHALIHKRVIHPYYVTKLLCLATELQLAGVTEDTLKEPRKAKRLLDAFLRQKGYSYCCPRDLSVYFNISIFSGTVDPATVQGVPALGPPAKLLSARILTEHEGVRYYSFVYQDPRAGGIVKLTTGDLAWRDAQFLRRLGGSFFPRVLEAFNENSWSVAVFERIIGRNLHQVVPKVAASPKSLAAFFGDCLDILEALQAVGITHRDITPWNLMLRDGRPVLIDFGCAVAPDAPCFTPTGLGWVFRPHDGSFCDVYSMGRVFVECTPVNDSTFAPLISAMTATDLQSRVTSIPALRGLLEELPLPACWDGVPVFSHRNPAENRIPWRADIGVLIQRVDNEMAKGDLSAACSFLETGVLNHPESRELKARLAAIHFMKNSLQFVRRSITRPEIPFKGSKLYMKRDLSGSRARRRTETPMPSQIAFPGTSAGVQVGNSFRRDFFIYAFKALTSGCKIRHSLSRPLSVK